MILYLGLYLMNQKYERKLIDYFISIVMHYELIFKEPLFFNE